MLNQRTNIVIITAILIFCVAIAYAVLQLNKKDEEISTGKNLDVPFTSQAPKADWHEPWLNACEETSIIMADSYYKNKEISPDQARQQILKILAIKEQKFGTSADESMERMAEIINLAGLPWKATVSVNPLLNDIKKEIHEGRPIIVPIDARLLENDPYDGTLDYHVLIISGYDDESEQFIVQDPGTKNGQNDRYGYEDLYNAINDYLPQATPSGRKAVLFTAPN